MQGKFGYTGLVHIVVECYDSVSFPILKKLSTYTSVRPKHGFGIGNRNQDQVSVSVSGPELFLPKPKLSPILKSTKNSVQL